VPSAVPINRKCWCCDWPIGDILVPHRVPPKGSVITAGLRLLTYTFSEIKVYFSSRGFLDIEKSVLLELKGVKVIRSYRDFFQLIRDFLRINDTFRLFYMISLLFARVINLIIVIVIVNNFCIVMVRIYNFVENKGIFQ